MDNFDEIERLLAELEAIPATNENLDAIDATERELMAKLALVKHGPARDDERAQELVDRAIDAMTGASARIEFQTAEPSDFGAE